MIRWKNIGVSLAFVILGLILLSMHFGRGSSFRVLDYREMRDFVRGAVPVACATQFQSGNCGDHLAYCAGMGQTDCEKEPTCTSCTNTANNEQACATNKPWNVLTCTQEQAVAGGCGYQMTGANCGWSKTKGTCSCSGGMKKNPQTNCNQMQATSTGAGNCTVQNP